MAHATYLAQVKIMPKLTRPLILILLVMTGCSGLPQSATLTPTRHLSAPTLAPSPTTLIRNSDELYGDTQFGGVGQNSLTAAGLPNNAAMPPLQSGTREPGGAETVQLVLNSGQILLGDLYEQIMPENRVPGILIIGRDRLSWGLLPAELFSGGYTVLVVEMPQDVQPSDLDVLLTSFSENGTVDPGRIAVIGAEDTADMALIGCAAYAICDAAVLLSPIEREHLINSLVDFNPRPLFVVAGQNDAQGYETSVALAADFAEGSQFVELASGRGTGLLALNSDLSQAIAQWLNTVFNPS